jgi:hypothetical protein
MAKPCPFRDHGKRSKLDNRLEDDGRFRRWVDLKVVVYPQRFEPRLLGILRYFDSAPPGLLGVYPEELPITALRKSQTYFHEMTSGVP